MTPNSKPPFDSFVLQALVEELQTFVGGKVQEIRQPGEYEVAIGLYAGGKEGMFLLSCDPVFFRAHLITRRPPTMTPLPQFLTALRSRIEGARVESIVQVGSDRIIQIELRGLEPYMLVAELMGKHSNIMLLDHHDKLIGAAKWVGRTKSIRPILPGVKYELPPTSSKTAALGGSKFYRDLIAAGGDPNRRQPVISPGHGAYPISVAPLGLPEHSRESISIALEQHFAQAIPAHEAETLRHSLLAQIDRVILARDAALSDLEQARAAGGKAAQWQRFGELILAFGASAPPGASTLNAFDYDGTELTIKLDEELDFKQNANRYFERAKRAKARLPLVNDQIARLGQDRAELQQLRSRVAQAERLTDLRELQDQARKHRWLTEQRAPTKTKEERPYEGHRVRELLGPGGYTILFGETAEANDYLTLRVAKPNDYWLHVRGSVSAHVVIATRNQPERVQKETLLFAAKVVVQHSPSKHAGYVPVDYTLKKYVRKPRGAPKGTALYTHEKTLHVES